MFLISNNGSELTSTNYWDSEHGRAGLCYLSGNAGAWRLLVPDALEHAIPEMLTGRSVTIEASIVERQAWDIVFEDGSQSPFALTLDRRMSDRRMKAGRCRISVWTRHGKAMELPCRIRV